jgi:hypothetical protein
MLAADTPPPSYTITLTKEEWAKIGALLVQAPYKDAAPIIAHIIEQTQKQDAPPPPKAKEAKP